MQTRSELRRQPTRPQEKGKSEHHRGLCLLGILTLTLLMVSMVINRTFLNRQFVTQEMTSSTLEDQLLSEVRSGITQYGIPGKVLTKHDTDQIVRTVVNQAFKGDRLHLNLQPVTDRLTSQAGSQLAQFGISAAQLPIGNSALIADNVNSAVNSRINTPQVASFISGLHMARTINNLILVISAAGLVSLIVWAAFRRCLLRALRWITSGALVASGLVFLGMRLLIPQLAQANPDYSAFAVQCASDFQQVAVGWLGALAIVTILCWLLFLLLSLRR